MAGNNICLRYCIPPIIAAYSYAHTCTVFMRSPARGVTRKFPVVHKDCPPGHFAVGAGEASASLGLLFGFYRTWLIFVGWQITVLSANVSNLQQEDLGPAFQSGVQLLFAEPFFFASLLPWDKCVPGCMSGVGMYRTLFLTLDPVCLVFFFFGICELQLRLFYPRRLLFTPAGQLSEVSCLLVVAQKIHGPLPMNR